MGAAGQRRPDDADIGHLVAAEIGLGDLEVDGLARRDDGVVERGDGLAPVMPLAFGVEGRGADGVLHEGVVGKQAQPALAVARRHGGPGLEAQLAGIQRCVGHVPPSQRTLAMTSSANRRRLSTFVARVSVSCSTP